MKLAIVLVSIFAVACAQLSSEYLPPNDEGSIGAPSNEYLAPSLGDATALGDDGYRYKTVRRLRHRRRRDVSELVGGEYLPPNQDISIGAPSNEYLAPSLGGGTVLADDGYRYKTVRRFRNRKRRDVSEIVGGEYLPPNQDISIGAPSNEYLAPSVGGGTVLADDGYRYKTVRRFRNRKRRDVSELVGGEYLPPTQDISIGAPSNEYLAPSVGGGTVLADDGYRYKTVRRLRHRRRRDVSELVGGEYLPPTQDISIGAPSNEYLAPSVGGGTVLADDGYRYKTVRRLRHRRRRDVSELVGGEYLPPTQDISIGAPSNEYLAPSVGSGTVLADDGYRYKTVRRLRHRRRRDVSELVGGEYLPPTQDISIGAPSNEYLAPSVGGGTVLADDGYRYRTVRRFRNRKRRDVSELVGGEYLPPNQDISIGAPSNEYLAPSVGGGTVLADDGYRYKTVRRFRNRRRH